MNCKKCDKQYHYCSSCGLCFPEEIGYCSFDCWESSDEYIEKQKRMEIFIDSLSNRQLSQISWIVQNVDMEYYESIFEGMILSKLKGE